MLTPDLSQVKEKPFLLPNCFNSLQNTTNSLKRLKPLLDFDCYLCHPTESAAAEGVNKLPFLNSFH